jgi:hypothetical protein
VNPRIEELSYTKKSKKDQIFWTLIIKPGGNKIYA